MFQLLRALPLVLLVPLAAQAQTLPPEQAAVHAHVATLASDEMRGREAGTPDFDRAADYVVAQFEAAGLTPGGTDGGWFQPVPLVTMGVDSGTLTITRDGTATALRAGADIAFAPSISKPIRPVAGEVVFAGYGIDAADTGYDAYAGLDVAGKIVAVLVGAPKDAPEAIGDEWGGIGAKTRAAFARGASGVLLIESAQQRERVPFSVIVNYLARGQTMLAPEGEAATAGDPLGMLSQEGAAKLFTGSGIDFAAVLAADANGGAMPTGALGATVEGRVLTKSRQFESRNVIGVIPGSDPTLATQYIVLSAHLDHVGVGRPDASGDTIYNGAMDNAIGVATVIEVARRCTSEGVQPLRSLMFVALTAEEKGLLGASYMAAHPPVPEGSQLVADINFDMPIMTYPIEDVVVLGEEHSTLGETARQSAHAVGLEVVPDPLPQENFFVRSDHYSFVQAGIPAISIDTGPGGEGAAAIRDFLDNHYHKPSDEVDLINWQSAAKFVDLCFDIVRRAGPAAERPAWNPGDEYGVRYNGYGATPVEADAAE